MATRRRLELDQPLMGDHPALAPSADTPAPRYRRPPDLSPHDWAIFLLQSAAEVEHALMVQYLFAAYSLRADDSPIDGHRVADWQEVVREIAREEMGHLLTVQNLLRLIGGPVCFDREDFPLRSQFYPFPFTLERLSKGSLAKYVFAEMSGGDIPASVLGQAERDAITAQARAAARHPGGSFVNHVGTLYDTLVDVFVALPPGDFRTDRDAWQALRWSGTTELTTTVSGVKLLPARNRDEAVAALRCIGRQGEVATDADSHFGRFLKIYRACPDETAALTWPVSENPTTNPDAPGATLVTDPVSVLWARLFNVRYRVVLTALAHAVAVPVTATTTTGTNVRRLVGRWLYDEMTPDAGSLGGLARDRLTQLPAAPGSSQNAGAPFELPYASVLPDQDSERWRVHLDLIEATAQLVDELEKAGQRDEHVDAIVGRDRARRQVIDGLLS